MPSGSSATQINQPGSARPENRPRKNARIRRRHTAATNTSADQWCTCRISSPPRTSKLVASTDRYARLIVTPSSNRYEPRYIRVAIEGRKNGSSRTPVTTATANEYPAIRPNTAAQRSRGSRRSAPGTSRRVPAASRPTAGPPLRGGLRRPATTIRCSSPDDQAADPCAAVVPPSETRHISVGTACDADPGGLGLLRGVFLLPPDSGRRGWSSNPPR